MIVIHAVIDVCDSSPCLNGANCEEEESDSYTCTCAAGFTGDTCETGKIDPGTSMAQQNSALFCTT